MRIPPILLIALLGCLTSCQSDKAAPRNQLSEIHTEICTESIQVCQQKARALFKQQEFVIHYRSVIEERTLELSVPAKADSNLRKLLLSALEQGQLITTPCDKPMYLRITIGPQAYDGKSLTISSTNRAGSPILLNTTHKEQIIDYINKL